MGWREMVCPKCAGSATQLLTFLNSWLATGPCPECQGSGIVSCCDTAGASDTYDMTGMYGEVPFTRPEDYWHGVDDEA